MASSDFLINKVQINELFGNLNHVIPLHSEGVTFVHGPNGCGKTTVLRLLAAVFSWDMSTLFDTRFSSIEVFNADGTQLEITRISEERDDGTTLVRALVFQMVGTDLPEFRIGRQAPDNRPSPGEIEDLFPFMTRIGVREWHDGRTGTRLQLQEVLDRYGHLQQPTANRPEWLVKYIERISLHFIKTQRLLKVDFGSERRHRNDEVSVADVIQIYATELKELISKKLAEQAAVAQIHDRSFPERLLSLTNADAVSETDIRTLYANTEDKIQRLVEAGLIEKQQNIPLPQKALESTERRVLSLYLEDVNKKLGVFDDLQEKIEIFIEVVAKKLRSKRFTVSRSDGFSIESKYLRETTHKPDDSLKPSQLSSGEQHQIVLFYELIFKAANNSFFLVDEPEISLHVDWQRQFLDDIRRIAKLGDRNFLIATHSPQIIGSHRDLAVALDGGILDA